MWIARRRSVARSASLWLHWDRPLQTTGRWRGSPESAVLVVRQLSTSTLPKPRSAARGQTPAPPVGDPSTDNGLGSDYSGGWAEAVYPSRSTPAPNGVGSEGWSDSVADDIFGHGRSALVRGDEQHQLNGHSNGAEHAEGSPRVVRMLRRGLEAEQEHRSDLDPLNVHGHRVQRILRNGAMPEGMGWAEAKRLFLGTTADGRGYEAMDAAEQLQWEQESEELKPATRTLTLTPAPTPTLTIDPNPNPNH